MENIKTETNELIEKEKTETLAEESKETPQEQKKEETILINEVEQLRKENEELKKDKVLSVIKDKGINSKYNEWVMNLMKAEAVELSADAVGKWIDQKSDLVGVFRNEPINASSSANRQEEQPLKVEDKKETTEEEIEIPGE